FHSYCFSFCLSFSCFGLPGFPPWRSHLAVHSFLRKILPGVAKTKILFGRAAETNTRTCEHNGKSAAIRESIVLPRQRFPYQRDQALRSATVWQRPANAHRPLTT